MADINGKEVSWKKLWQLISGIHYETPKKTVLEKLKEVINQLRDGVLSKPIDDCVAKEIKDKTTLNQFCENVQQYLSISLGQASNLICSYLINEYQGSASALINCLATDQQRHTLLVDISKYYSLERMILLKIVRNLLELSSLKNHPYSEEYSIILDEIKLSTLRSSYLKQFKYLISPNGGSGGGGGGGGSSFGVSNNIMIPFLGGGGGGNINVNGGGVGYFGASSGRGNNNNVASSASGGGTTDFLHSHEKLTASAEQKIRETIEILHILLLIVENDGIQSNEFNELVDLFRNHSFGRQQQYLDAGNSFHVDLVTKVTYCEVALFLKCVDTSNSRLNSETYVQETIKILDKQIVGLHHNPEHGPILLAWMLFNFSAIKNFDDDAQLSRYRQFGSRAVQLGVFDYLHKLVSHTMYKDQSVTSRLVRQTIYAHLNQLCDLFDGDGSVANHAKIYDLLSELLRTPSIAKSFCNREDTGVRSLYNTVLENFPTDFINLSMISTAVASSGSSQQTYMRKQLENLPMYTEYYKPDIQIQLKRSDDISDSDNEFVLINSPYIPFKKIDYQIGVGTSVVLQDKQYSTTVHFRTQLNYFNVLHNEINVLLEETLLRYGGDDDNEQQRKQQRVTAGLKYLAVAVRAVRNPQIEISNEMVHPTEMVFDILSKFKQIQSPPINLLAKCLDICTALLPLFENEIYRRVINLNLFPFITNAQLDAKSYCDGVSFESGLVGYYLINFEKNIGRYEFLITYLRFLKAYTKLEIRNSIAIDLPGLIFMLREIFPHLYTWRFEKESDRQLIYTLILQYFLSILQQTPSTISSSSTTSPKLKEHDSNYLAIQILQNTCVYSLLNYDNAMTLLRFVAIGNSQLQSAMQNTSNWMMASDSGLNLLVQLSMAILMQILRLRHGKPDYLDKKSMWNNNNNKFHDESSLSALESIIYTQPKQRDTLRIIPVVTSYMSNIFNRRLPLLACRLLRRFAIEFQMSLLACLDMEPDQIRLTFLQILPDSLESEDLKVAVIEFVEACINKQPGLTEAFFKIKTQRRVHFDNAPPRTKDISAGILTYMTQYLDQISKDPGRIVSRLLSKIMSLFHALWKHNMQSLAQELIKQPTFWSSLFNPLYDGSAVKDDIQAYSQLFNILGIELFRCAISGGGGGGGGGNNDEERMNPNLRSAFEHFFEPKIFKKWVDNILQLPKQTIDEYVSDETPEWLCRLQSFKDFFVILMRRKPTAANGGCGHGTIINIPYESKEYFANKCLEALVERSQYIDDFRPFSILAELYLILLLSFQTKYTVTAEEDEKMLANITTLLRQTSISYREIHCRAGESVLAIALRSIDLFGEEIGRSPEIASDFMRSIIDIMCQEINEIDRSIAGGGGNIGSSTNHLPFILSMNLMKKISLNFVEIDGLDGAIGLWHREIVSNKIINRLMSCLNVTIQVHRNRKIVLEMLDLLIVLAKGICSSEFLHCDIGFYLWMKLLPPKELLLQQGFVATVNVGGVGGSSSSNSSTIGSTNLTSSGAQMNQTNMMSSGATVTSSMSDSKWQTNDWWPVYARGIKLVTVLLQCHGHLFVKDATMFVGVHEEYLMDSILLAKQSMDVEAVKLIKIALLFVAELTQYEKQWRLDHPQSLISLMRCVQTMLDHGVSLLYRPKILQRLMSGSSTIINDAAMGNLGRMELSMYLQDFSGVSTGGQTLTPSDELITAMDDLIEIVIICSKCLLVFSPKLLALIVEPEFVPRQWQPLVEIQFGAPKLNVGGTVPQLTFGTILSAISIFTKALNLQNYTFHDVLLNRIRTSSNTTTDTIDGISDLTQNSTLQQNSFINSGGLPGTSTSSPSRSLYTKSLSMTSTTSTVTTVPSNEILSNLDETLCLTGLEFLLTLLASQSLLALKDQNLSIREKQLIKRELSTELAVYHDFVRKRILIETKGPLYRKKRGIVQFKCGIFDGDNKMDDDYPDGGGSNEEMSTPVSSPQKTAAAGSARGGNNQSMREHVMRKLHAAATKSVSSGGQVVGSLKRPTVDVSPIQTSDMAGPSGTNSGVGGRGIQSSTPMEPSSSSLTSTGRVTIKPHQRRVTFTDSVTSRKMSPPATSLSQHDEAEEGEGADDENDGHDSGNNVMMTNEHIGGRQQSGPYTGLSMVQLVEADYLHLLSLLFIHFCQNE